MAEKSNIQWCDSTVNFWSGCTKVSPGCAHCYAETRDKRHMIEPVSHWGKGAPRLRHVGAVKQALAMNRMPWICDKCGEAMQKPANWARTHKEHGLISKIPDDYCCIKVGCDGSVHRRRIFANSLSDWLDGDASLPVAWLIEMLHTVWQCREVIWILCTKRPELFKARMKACLDVITDGTGSNAEFWQWLVDWMAGKPPGNIILGEYPFITSKT